MKIKVKLSPAGIEQAKKELLLYKAELNRRMERLVKELAKKGRKVAEDKFSEAKYDGENDVSVSIDVAGMRATIVASGKAVLFIEFGSGTSFPEHPSGLFAHGEYGKGRGDAEKYPSGWVYKGQPGTGGQYVRDGVYRTQGNPPAMAMWSAVEELAAQVEETWQEVLRS